MDILKLKGMLAERGLNMSKLARAIGVNRDTLYRHFRDDSAKITVDDIRKIAKALDVDVLIIAKICLEQGD